MKSRMKDGKQIGRDRRSTPTSTPTARHEVMREKTYTQNSYAAFAFARAPREAQEKAHRDAAAPTAKGAPGQPSGAPHTMTNTLEGGCRMKRI